MRRMLLVAALPLLLAALPVHSAEPAHRNVLLLFADDLGNDCGCYGNDKIKTPNIDVLANALEYPCAQDLYDSLTWQGVLKRGDTMLGNRPLDADLHRPHEELYDLDKDPDELKNVAADAKYADVMGDLRGRLKEWQEKTKDPWIVKYQHK